VLVGVRGMEVDLFYHPQHTKLPCEAGIVLEAELGMVRRSSRSQRPLSASEPSARIHGQRTHRAHTNPYGSGSCTRRAICGIGDPRPHLYTVQRAARARAAAVIDKADLPATSDSLRALHRKQAIRAQRPDT